MLRSSKIIIASISSKLHLKSIGIRVVCGITALTALCVTCYADDAPTTDYDNIIVSSSYSWTNLYLGNIASTNDHRQQYVGSTVVDYTVPDDANDYSNASTQIYIVPFYACNYASGISANLLEGYTYVFDFRFETNNNYPISIVQGFASYIPQIYVSSYRNYWVENTYDLSQAYYDHGNWNLGYTYTYNSGTGIGSCKIYFNTNGCSWLPKGNFIGFPFRRSRGSLGSGLHFELASYSFAADPDLAYYRNQVLDSLNEFADQNHKDLTQIHDDMVGIKQNQDYWYSQILDDNADPDKTLDGTDVDNMTNNINDVYDAIGSYEVDIDGQKLSIDANTFSWLTSYIESNAHGYNILVGQPINRVITLFGNYLAVPLCMSLMFGLATWFLGKESG